jgi:dTDP-N-acetylfucosamine:lipid II N-acetylfucosaminyltransferase
MIIHIFISENLYSLKYMKFLEDNFDLSSSRFVFKKRSGKDYEYSDNFKGKIFYPRNNIQLVYRLLPELRSSSRILFHQLPYGPATLLWNLFPGLLAKVTWIIWGGDVYLYRQKNKSLSARFYEWSRKMLIRRIQRIASFVPGDYEIIRKAYGIKADYLPCMYPLPVDFMHTVISPDPDHAKGVLRILAGNSGNPSNLHHEILAKLEPLKNSSIRIYCPLSYSGNPDYINTVIEHGEKIFGPGFIPMIELLDPDKYLNLLYNIDVAIMNHDRQQGLGNILPLLYFGKRVWMRSGTSSFEYLKSLGCRLYDIQSINTFDNSIFGSDEDTHGENKMIIQELLSETRCRKLWEQILY